MGLNIPETILLILIRFESPSKRILKVRAVIRQSHTRTLYYYVPVADISRKLRYRRDTRVSKGILFVIKFKSIKTMQYKTLITKGKCNTAQFNYHFS